MTAIPHAPRKRYDLAAVQNDFPPWEGPPRRTILICTHVRSGSTLLGEALHFAGGLGCPLEYFHAGFQGAFGRWGPSDFESRYRGVLRHRTDPSGTLAVKLFWRDLVEIAVARDPARFGELAETLEHVAPETYAALGELVRELFPSPVLIHLERRDRLRQAVSALIANDTGNWRLIPRVEEAPDDAEPVFDTARIERLIGYGDLIHDNWRNLFAAMGEVPHHLTYEALMTDYEPVLRDLLARLGSTSAPPAPRMRKQADARSEAFVLRYLRERRPG